MENTNISLCITYPRLNDPDKNMKFRIADKVENNLNKTIYTFGDSETKIIYSRPSDSIPFNVELVKWWYDFDDPYKTRSEVYDTNNIYEILMKKKDIDKWRGNYDKVALDIKKGYQLSEGITEQFFIVIGETVSFYKAILCDKKDSHNGIYRLDFQSDNMGEATSTLGVYNILKTSVIETRDLFIRTIDDNLVDRLFYNKLELPSRIDEISIFGVKDYVPYILKKYIKGNKNKFDFTNNQIKNIIYMINEFIKDQNEIHTFEVLTGRNYEQILTDLKNLEIDLDEFLGSESEIDLIINNIVQNNDEYIIEIRELVKNELLSSQNIEIETINREISELEHTYEEKAKEIKKLLDNKEHLVIEIENLNNDVKELELKSENYELEIEGLLKNYKEDSLKIFGTLEIYKYMNQETVTASENIVIQRGKTIDENASELDDFSSYIEDLRHNLECIGIQEKHCEDLAMFLLVIMKLSIPLIIPEIIAKKLANAISYITDNQSSSEVILYEKDLSAFDIKKIEEINGRILYIDKSIENIQEHNLIKLAGIKNKLIVIPYKDHSIIRILSDVIFDYFTIVDLDDLMTIELDEEFYFGTALDKIFTRANSSQKKSKEYFIEYASNIKSDKIRKSNLLKHSRIKDMFMSLKGKGKDSKLLINEISLLDKDVEELLKSKSNQFDVFTIGES